VAVPDFSFADDTFAFPNMIRSRHPDDEPGLYANYCFVLARALRQFAQFVPLRSRAAKARSRGIRRAVNQIGAQTPWDPVPPPASAS